MGVVEQEGPQAVVEVGTSCFEEPGCLLLSSETPSRRLLKNHPFPLMDPWVRDDRHVKVRKHNIDYGIQIHYLISETNVCSRSLL